MRFRGTGAMFCGALWLLAGGAASGQSAKADGGPKYDPKTVVELLGTVSYVEEAPQGSPMSGVHVTVKTKSESLEAYLGPAEFLKGFELAFAKGDHIHLTGSKVAWEGEKIVLAREVRKDGTTVYLRDEHGAPYWPAS